MSHYDYTTPCVFNQDHVEEKARWIIMPDSVPCFDGWSAVVNLDWEPDKEWYQDPIGEVWGNPRPYDAKVIPFFVRLLMGQHVCGSKSDFEHGGIYDPSQGPTIYGSYGWPICCNPPLQLKGGPGAGGYSPMSITWFDAPSGGYAIGGMIGDKTRTVDSLEGGLAIGGAVGDLAYLTDSTEGGTALGGAGGDSFSGTDPTAGGVALGGTAGDTLSVTDPTAGGVALGGTAGDKLAVTDPPAGGLGIGGAAGNVIRFRNPALGGLGIGGFILNRFLAKDPAAGGLGFGGAVGDTSAVTDPTAGGLGFGGSAGDVYTPGQPTPGTNCAGAASVTQSVTYSYSISAGFAVEQWFTYTLPSTGNWHVATTGLSMMGVNLQIYSGGSCPFPNLLAGATFGPPRWSWAGTAGDVIRLKFTPAFMGTVAYTFVWDSGL